MSLNTLNFPITSIFQYLLTKFKNSLSPWNYCEEEFLGSKLENLRNLALQPKMSHSYETKQLVYS